MVTSLDALSSFVNTSVRSFLIGHALSGITMLWVIGRENVENQGIHRVVLPATQEEQ